MSASTTSEPASLHLAMVTFARPRGAEQAFAQMRESCEGAEWLRELALIHRGRRRITVHGTFAGRYLDVEDDGDVIGRDTVIGALTGAVIGAVFGPPGFAAGLVAGGSIGGLTEATHHEEPHGELYEQIRVHVPHGSSAVILLASSENARAMLEAFADYSGHPYDRALTAEQVAVLKAAVADAPPAAEPESEEPVPEEPPPS